MVESPCIVDGCVAEGVPPLADYNWVQYPLVTSRSLIEPALWISCFFLSSSISCFSYVELSSSCQCIGPGHNRPALIKHANPGGMRAQDQQFLLEEDISVSYLTVPLASSMSNMAPRPRFASLDAIAPFIPEIDPKNPRAQTFTAWASRRDVVLNTISIISTCVLLLNTISTVVLGVKYGNSELFRGSCSRASRFNLGIHILINVLSTLLLGASNLCMQLLTAPTRAEVDFAHKKRVWLDIGIPSYRNLKHISRNRKVTWWVLALSSLPLHFL